MQQWINANTQIPTIKSGTVSNFPLNMWQGWSRQSGVGLWSYRQSGRDSIMRAASHLRLRKQAIQMLVCLFYLLTFLLPLDDSPFSWPCLSSIFLSGFLNPAVFYVGEMKVLPEDFLGSAKTKVSSYNGKSSPSKSGEVGLRQNTQQPEVRGEEVNVWGSISPAERAALTCPACLLGLTWCLYCQVGERGFVLPTRWTKQDREKVCASAWPCSLGSFLPSSRLICKTWRVCPPLCTCQCQHEA